METFHYVFYLRLTMNSITLENYIRKTVTKKIVGDSVITSLPGHSLKKSILTFLIIESSSLRQYKRIQKSLVNPPRNGNGLTRIISDDEVISKCQKIIIRSHLLKKRETNIE